MLFPMVRTLVSATSPPGFHCGSITRPIALMEREHIVVGELLEQLRTLTHGYQAPEGTCASTQALMAGLAELEADTHLHVHKENNHLFPAVTAMEERLTVGDQL
jgi:regulator of cell morphogenesis and NO signaling